MIVYIDDEAALCEVFDFFLSEHELEGKSFIDCVEAVNFIKSEPSVKIVICDFRMRKMNAFQVYDEIGEGLDFIISTGELELELPDHMKDKVPVYIKPVEFEELPEVSPYLKRE